MRLLCTDPQLLSQGMRATDALITLTCDADWDYVAKELGSCHGRRS